MWVLITPLLWVCIVYLSVSDLCTMALDAIRLKSEGEKLLERSTSQICMLEDLLKEAAEHIDGVTGAKDKPRSDSGELYHRIMQALTKDGS